MTLMSEKVCLSKSIRFLVAVTLIFGSTLVFLPSASYAEEVILKLPLPERSGTAFGYSASRGRLHAGVDLRARSPTKITYIGNHQGCPKSKDGMLTGLVANACSISQRFLHMTSCDAGNYVTGNSGINKGTGKPYDYHLHWEVNISGTPVDPEKAVGKNLCDTAVRKELLDDAKTKGSGSGGGGASAGSNAPAPPVNNSPEAQSKQAYVAPGATNPFTGVVNTGNSYFYTEGIDGRVTIELAPDPGGENYEPLLPPSTETFTQPATSSNEVTGCATDTWKAMVNQAVLQTRREMLYNERFIAKGDSVLAYACFEAFLKDMGPRMKAFSTSKRWVNVDIDIMGKTVKVNKELGENSLDGAIRNAAIIAGQSFINSHAKHGYLGGTLGSSGSTEDVDEGGQQVDVPCGMMAQVWNSARCMNMADDPGFKKFEDLIDSESDPRKYPPNLQCKNTGITQGMIDIAKGKEVKVSKFETHFDKLRPAEGTCAEAIATGVTVTIRKGDGILSKETTYPDGVCVSPGCSYQNSGSGQGKCEAKKP